MGGEGLGGGGGGGGRGGMMGSEVEGGRCQCQSVSAIKELGFP